MLSTLSATLGVYQMLAQARKRPVANSQPSTQRVVDTGFPKNAACCSAVPKSGRRLESGCCPSARSEARPGASWLAVTQSEHSEGPRSFRGFTRARRAPCDRADTTRERVAIDSVTHRGPEESRGG